MSSFQVPFSSSPLPSTPDRRTKNGAGQFSFGASNPSTTPAGPLPSSAGSFTPAGPPPSSVLGSSIIDGRYNHQPFPSLRFSNENVPKPSQNPSDTDSSTSSSAPQNGSTKASRRSNLSNKYKAPAEKQKFGGFSADLYDEDEDEHDEDGMEEEGRNPEEYDYSDEAEGNIDDAMAEDGSYDDVQDMEDHRIRNLGPGPKSSLR